MTLLNAEVGKEYIVSSINTNDDELNSFLFSLGCYSGEPITVISHIKGGCIITVNFTAMIFFKEKMTWRSIVGSLVALVGVIVMNIL